MTEAEMIEDSPRAKIMRAASQVFDEFGYSGATMDRIAAESGYSKPALYYYFKSKSEIIYLMHEEMITVMMDRHRQRVRAEASPSELLQAIFRDVVGLMDDRRGYVRVFFEYQRELSSVQRRKVLARRAEYTTAVERVLDRGIADGLFADVDVSIATRGIFGMCNYSYQWYRPGGKSTSVEVADELWRLFSRGLLAR
ncbi:MAG TPA: TetR/AcrR family transcriptional regulator [Streptosporangiaceae bacterium]|nr:TetR/AcrR family transcriptional regulator [Streptosporangiaceae bacterium]